MQVLSEPGEQAPAKLSLATLLDIVAPVLQQFILEGKAAEDSGHEIKQVCKFCSCTCTTCKCYAATKLVYYKPHSLVVARQKLMCSVLTHSLIAHASGSQATTTAQQGARQHAAAHCNVTAIAGLAD